MTRQITLACAALFAAFTAGSAFAAPAEDLDSVKALYAEASYEEALAKLDTLDGEIDPVMANQYRALCLLGLGKTRDAEAPLQRIVAANPLYTITPGDVSPRLVDLFKAIRCVAVPVGIERTIRTDLIEAPPEANRSGVIDQHAPRIIVRAPAACVAIRESPHDRLQRRAPCLASFPATCRLAPAP